MAAIQITYTSEIEKTFDTIDPGFESEELNMEIIDNINHLLGDNLKQTIKPGSKLKIAASCFSIYPFEAFWGKPLPL